jgi:hypothetical protein
MATTKLQAGYSIDTLTAQELRHELRQAVDHTTQSWFREQARGFDHVPFDGVATVSAGAVAFPSTSDIPIGPRPGYAWSVRRFSADGLAAADVLKIYRNTISPRHFLGQILGTTGYFSPGSKALILRATDTLHFSGTGLTATGDITVNGEAIVVAESDLYKII